MKYLYKNGSTPTHNDPLTEKVIGLAIDVHKELGPGFPEKIYHRSLEIQLAEAGIAFTSEAPLEVKFKGRIVGTFVADMLVDGNLIVELKALEELPLIAEIQVVSYLKASGHDVGLILNFGQFPLQIKRKYRTRGEIDFDLRLHED
jgi:GxxExxY protein